MRWYRIEEAARHCKPEEGSKRPYKNDILGAPK